MRNMYFFEKLILFGAIGALCVLVVMGGGFGTTIVLAPILLGIAWLYYYSGERMNAQASAAVAHANANFSSTYEGTAISIAYAANGSRPALQVSSQGRRGTYQSHELRSVGLQDDRKGVYRYVLLLVKDAEHPEWLIHFRSVAEAKSWKERILQFCEERGGE